MQNFGFLTAYLKYEFTLLFPSQLETKVWITHKIISKAWQNIGDKKRNTSILLPLTLHGAVRKKPKASWERTEIKSSRDLRRPEDKIMSKWSSYKKWVIIAAAQKTILVDTWFASVYSCVGKTSERHLQGTSKATHCISLGEIHKTYRPLVRSFLSDSSLGECGLWVLCSALVPSRVCLILRLWRGVLGDGSVLLLEELKQDILHLSKMTLDKKSTNTTGSI